MNRNNKRIRQSIRLISNALLSLLEKKDFAEVTISEICEAATVSRNTFYRLFLKKEDVLRCVLEEKAGYIMNQFVLLENYELARPSEEDIRRTYERFYGFWYDQRKLLETLRAQGLLWLLDEAILKELPVHGEESYDALSMPVDPDFFADYFYYWHAMSMSNIIEKWVIRGCRESVEDLVTVTIRLHQTMNFQWE